MTAYRFIAIILILTLFSGCGSESKKPIMKKTSIEKHETNLLETLTNETYAFKNAESSNGYKPFPAIYKNKLLFMKNGSDDKKFLKLTDIKTGKDIWSVESHKYFEFNFIKNDHLFGSSIIDLDTGKTTLDCINRLGIELNERNTQILDQNTAVVFNAMAFTVFMIDYITGKIIWEQQDKNKYFDCFEIKDITKVNDIYIYYLDLMWGKPDGLIDLVYHCKSEFGYNGLMAINIKSGKFVLLSKAHDMIINNGKIIYLDIGKLRCFDLITEKELWSMNTCEDNCTCGNTIFGNYKTNVIVPLETGIMSIDCLSGKINWINKINDPYYWTDKGMIEDGMLSFKLDTGRYIMKDTYWGDLINYHYFFDCKLDLNNGMIIDKQLAKDDTGKYDVIVNKQKTINGITITIKQNLSKKDENKSRSTVTFTDDKSKTTFEFKGNDSMPIYGIEMHEIDGIYYGYRSVYDIIYGCPQNIKKEGEKFIVKNIPCSEIVFEKNKSVTDLNTYDCESNLYRKIQAGDDSYDLARNYFSRTSNGKMIWEIKQEFYLHDNNNPYFDEHYIAFSDSNEIKLIDNETGNVTDLPQTIFLHDKTELKNRKRIEYLITYQDDTMFLHKLKKTLVEFK